MGDLIAGIVAGGRRERDKERERERENKRERGGSGRERRRGGRGGGGNKEVKKEGKDENMKNIFFLKKGTVTLSSFMQSKVACKFDIIVVCNSCLQRNTF